MDKSTREKIKWDLNSTINQLYLADVYRTAMPYTFFSRAHGAVSRIDHILGHKLSLSRFKKRDNILSIFSDHNNIKMEINNKGKLGKFINLFK